MSGLRWLSLVFMFCIDVHVKADALKECWGKEIPCAVQASQNKRVITAQDLRVTLGANALLEHRDEKTIQLIGGDFYVETSKSVIFGSPDAKVWCEGESCKALFSRSAESLNIKSLEGRWLVERKGEKSLYTVPAGLQVTIGEVTSSGQAEMEFPQSLPWAPTVKEWVGLYPGTMSELKPSLTKFREVWKSAVESVSQTHQQAASRTIASFEHSQAKERARIEAREREDLHLREMFRDKNP